MISSHFCLTGHRQPHAGLASLRSHPVGAKSRRCLTHHAVAPQGATHRNNVAWCVTSLEGGGDFPASWRARSVHHFRFFRGSADFTREVRRLPLKGATHTGGAARSRIVARWVDFRRPVSERSGADQCNLRGKVEGGNSGESAGSARRGKSEKGEQQVGHGWTDEHCPHIHGAGRTAVIERDHGAVRRAELSTRESGQLRGERGARWICGQCGVGKNLRARERWAYPLDDGVGRSAGPLRDARIRAFRKLD